MAKPRYERRIMLFLDFLGFKEIVEQTVAQPKRLNELITALNELKKGNKTEGTRVVTHFSDSVVMSYPQNFGAAHQILFLIGWTVLDLTRRGFLVRGAVTAGDLYHTENHVVGPAMVRAYETESRMAIYPRVIIDPYITGIVGEDSRPVLPRFATRDADGQYYVDYLSWKSFMTFAGSAIKYYPKHLQATASVLEIGLKHSDPRVLKKYLWLHQKYFKAIHMFDGGRKDWGPHRLTDPKILKAILALPRLQEHADAAKKMVMAAEKLEKRRSIERLS